MVFSSLIFLCIFFPVQMILYTYAKNLEAKNTVLIVFSLIFYAWGEPSYIVVLLFMALFDWYMSQFLEQYGKSRKGKLILAVTLAVNIGMLAFFKYGNFTLQNLQLLTGSPKTLPNIALPIGISFYTFQLISYVVDVYRGEVPAQPYFKRLLLYVCLFHQCIAGPIVRYQDVAERIVSRKVTARDMSDGINRFAAGLAKKVLLANICGEIATGVLGAGLPDATGAALAALKTVPALSLWLGCIAYALQIYLDFSAYSDMAIGMGMMVGFRYKENFNYPYLSASITEFWRRWHMSLSYFFRDYVYIPLGGNRKGKTRMLLNMLVVWLLTGMWHGAGWNFILWGIYYFAFLTLEKLWLGKRLEALPKWVSHVYALLVILFGWILFYFQDMSQVGAVLAGLFGLNGNGFVSFEAKSLLTNNLFFLAAAMVGCTQLPSRLYQKVRNSESPLVFQAGCVLEYALPSIAIFLSVCFLASNSYNAFLYMQF